MVFGGVLGIGGSLRFVTSFGAEGICGGFFSRGTMISFFASGTRLGFNSSGDISRAESCFGVAGEGFGEGIIASTTNKSAWKTADTIIKCFKFKEVICNFEVGYSSHHSTALQSILPPTGFFHAHWFHSKTTAALPV
jgi:hypothetical protein